MLMTVMAIAVAIFFAANIGASGTAASMGSAYGSGAVRSRLHAVLLAAGFAVFGAFIGGEGVISTISKGIIPSAGITTQLTVIILGAACFTLFIANRMGIPLSTSEVTVGSLVGAGMAIGHVYWSKLIVIAGAWIVLPFAAYTIAYGFGRLTAGREQRWMSGRPRVRLLLSLLLTAAGCYEAFSAGMNNVANAVGPLIGGGVLDLQSGLVIGSLFLAVGAVAMGGRVLETNGKKITPLSLLQGSVVSFTSGTLVIIASMFGLPVPLTQATTMAIIGVGAENRGFRHMLKLTIVRKILFVWIASPVSSMVVSYALTKWTQVNAVWPVTALAVIPIVVVLFRTVRLKRLPTGETSS